jgi:hypothetical protein
MTVLVDFRETIKFRELNILVYIQNGRRLRLNRFKAILKRSIKPPLIPVFHYLEKDSGVEHVKAAWALRGIYETFELEQ